MNVVSLGVTELDFSVKVLGRGKWGLVRGMPGVVCEDVALWLECPYAGFPLTVSSRFKEDLQLPESPQTYREQATRIGGEASKVLGVWTKRTDLLAQTRVTLPMEFEFAWELGEDRGKPFAMVGLNLESIQLFYGIWHSGKLKRLKHNSLPGVQLGKTPMAKLRQAISDAGLSP